jgi:hypothetical protein
MMRHKQKNDGRGAGTVAEMIGIKRAKSTQHCIRIRVTDEEGGKLWEVISDNDWSGEYLGKNVFIFTKEQLDTIKAAGVEFELLDE